MRLSLRFWRARNYDLLVRLLERDAELELLRAAVADAARGRGCAVLVGASAGMGKTSLVQAAAGEVRHPVRVLRAAADDMVTPAPLGPVRDLAVAFRGTRAAAVLGGSADVVEVGHALLAELSPPQAPALVVVEDAHWADTSTVDVLTYLIRRCAGLRAAIVVTYRDDDLDEDGPWRRALGVLSGPQIRRLSLHGLSERAISSVLVDSPLVARDVLRATGGNPLLVSEVASAGVNKPTATIQDVALGRLARLPASARRLVEAVSVVPGRVERGLARRLDDENLLQLLERRHVLHGDPQAVWFPHELLRRAVEEAVPEDERQRHHARVLAALLAGAAGSAGAARLVHHAACAQDRPAVAQYAPSAAREALTAGANRESIAHLALALERPDLLPLQEQLDLRAEYAMALWHADRTVEAQEQAQRVLKECTSPAHDRYAARALIAWACGHPGGEEISEAVAAAQRAVRLLERHGDSEDLGWTLCWTAAITMLSPEHERTTDAIARAIEIGERFGNKGIVGHATIVRGQTGFGTPQGAQDLRAGLELVTATGHRTHQMWALHELGASLMQQGDLRGAAEAFRQGHDLAQDLTQVSWAIESADGRACALIGLGQWREAEQVLRALLRAHPDDAEAMLLPHATLGVLLARRGDPEGREHIEETWQIASRGRTHIRKATALRARFEVAWLGGRVDELAGEVPGALHAAELEHQDMERALLSVTAARAGVPVAVFDSCPEPWASSLRGDHRAAADGFGRRGDRYEQALELAASGDPDDALEALRLLDGLGAAGTALLVRRRLRVSGVRAPSGPRSSTRAHPAGLTGRQADVLALLTEGLSDAEIADRLVLSVRTVHHHVSAILQALGVSSRREAARAAAAQGLARAPR